MYDIYEKLLKEKGVKTADVCRATGLKAPTFSDWKKGKSAPNVDKLILIAEYFGVSVAYLRTGKEIDNKELARIDVELSKQDIETKNYMLKFAKLEIEKKKQIMSLIDMLSN